jgi:primary-amine oxidase
VNLEPIADPSANPAGNAFVARVSPLETESQARRLLHMPSGRHWRMTHASKVNVLGHAAGYMLAPRGNAFPLALPESSIRRRASFLNAHLWCTPYSETERYAAGRFVNQSDGSEGLAAWAAQDRSLKAADLVWWYTLGVNHVPRPEEWPVMTTQVAGFQLKPWGFFDRNPALDAP